MLKITIKKRTLQNIGLIFLGIFLALIILEIILRGGELILLGIQRHENNIPVQMDVYRILTLGESTSANLHDGGSSWPEQLQAILNNRSKNTKFKVFNEAIPGTNTVVILSKLEDNLDKYKPNIVVVMIGINDEGLNFSSYNEAIKKQSFIRDFRVYKLAKLLLEDLSIKIGKNKEYEGRIDDGTMTVTEFRKKEDELKKAIELNPSHEAFADLEDFYNTHYKFQEFEKLAETDVRLHPDDQLALFNLGFVYEKLKRYKKAEEIFSSMIDLNPNVLGFYIRLSDVYKKQKKFKEAIGTYSTFFRKNPFNGNESIPTSYDAIINFAELFREVNDSKNTYKMLKLLLLSSPTRQREVFWMGEIYKELNKTDETITLLQNIIIKDPSNEAAYIELAWHNLENNRTSEAGGIFRKIERISSHSLLHAYENIAERYEKIGQIDKSKEMRDMAYELRQNDFKITQKNYLQLYATVHGRGIKLMAMQYPTLKVDELKSIFKGGEDIIFISNEENFKKALQSSSYDDYFVDSFRKTWGHATKRGNQLIAENAADEVLKVVKNS